MATLPLTSEVLASGKSVSVTWVASLLPLLVTWTWYSRVSPGDGKPLPSASTSRVTSFDARRTGAASMRGHRRIAGPGLRRVIGHHHRKLVAAHPALIAHLGDAGGYRIVDRRPRSRS